jgi:hypothetical protein
MRDPSFHTPSETVRTVRYGMVWYGSVLDDRVSNKFQTPTLTSGRVSQSLFWGLDIDISTGPDRTGTEGAQLSWREERRRVKSGVIDIRTPFPIQ